MNLAKLTPPQLPTVLERPRLFAELDRLRQHHRVIWLQGPPGAGKTTLVSHYLHTNKLKPLWYQLDAGDADPGTWFHYLSLGMKTVAPRYKTPLPRLSPEYLPGIQVFTRRFFEQVYDRLKPPGVVVFDNYHEVPSEGHWQELMLVALMTIPSTVTVLVLSRQPPPAPLARLEANQHLAQLDPDLLLVTQREITALAHLQSQSGLSPRPPATIQQIYQKTKGWVAGVVLLLNRHEQGIAGGQEIDTEVTPLVFDYLAAEVLRNREKDERELLLHTAWFPSFTARMARDLTGQAKAERLFNALTRARYFTERRTGVERVYQYHPLFRDFLQHEAVEHWPEPQIQEVQQRAARILEQAGRVDEALALYVEAEQFEDAERVLLHQAPQLFRAGRAFAIEAWVRRLPDRRRADNPWLRYWEATGQFLRNPNSSVPLFEALYKEFEQRQDAMGQWLAWCGMMDGIVFSFTGYRRMEPWIEGVLQKILGATKCPFPSQEIEGRVTVTLFAAMIWTRLSDPRVFQVEERVQQILQCLPDYSQRLQAGFYVFTLWSWMGDMKQMERWYRTFEEWAKHPHISPLSQAFFHWVQAIYAWHHGNGERTLDAFEKGQELIRDYGLVMVQITLQSMGVAGALLLRDIVYMNKLVEDSRSQGEHALEIHGSAYHDMAAHACYLKGQREQSFIHAQKMKEFEPGLTCEFLLAFHRFTIAQLYTERGEWALAEHEIHSIEQTDQRIPSQWLQYFLWFLRAHMELARGNEEKWKKSLRQWLSHSRQQQLIAPLLWLPPIMTRLCGQALEAGIEEEHVRYLIKTLALVPEHTEGTSDQWPWPVKVYTLGRFELIGTDGPLTFGRKTPKAPLALLKVLIVCGGKDVAQSQVMDWLWPDADGAAAYRSLKMTVSRLRKIVKQDKAILFSGGVLSLHPEVCWVDSLNFQYLVNQSKIEAKQGNEGTSVQCAERARGLYKGELFPHDDDSWVLSRREFLQKQHASLTEHV